jgi:hypothetical protein
MTKWLVTYTRRSGARWNVIDFGGKQRAESRGIVDLMAIRKDHRRDRLGLRRGDAFEIVLTQTKGGSARRPTAQDVARLASVARRHRATAVILAEWKRAETLDLFKLSRSRWVRVTADEIFG